MRQLVLEQVLIHLKMKINGILYLIILATHATLLRNNRKLEDKSPGFLYE